MTFLDSLIEKLTIFNDHPNKLLCNKIVTDSIEKTNLSKQNYLKDLPQLNDIVLYRKTNEKLYCSTLKKLIENYRIVDCLHEKILKCICLQNRKSILINCLEAFIKQDYAVFVNLVPIQVEGMFEEFLKDITTFKRFSKMELYETAVLKEKIAALQDNYNFLYPNAIEYYMCYFNNIIRNKIAHGKGIYKSMLEVEFTAYELLLDLNTLVYMIMGHSETEKMYKYVLSKSQKIKNAIQRKDELSCYKDLYYSISGQQTFYDYEWTERFRPIKVIYWLLNPYYENLYCSVGEKDDLVTIRKTILSTRFWEFVENELLEMKASNGYTGLISKELISIVKGLFRCQIDDKTKEILASVHSLLIQLLHY